MRVIYAKKSDVGKQKILKKILNKIWYNKSKVTAHELGYFLENVKAVKRDLLDNIFIILSRFKKSYYKTNSDGKIFFVIKSNNFCTGYAFGLIEVLK